MVTGMRGLCNGLGPAVYGFVFNLFNVDITHNVPIVGQYPGGGERGALLINDRMLNSSVSHSFNLPENLLIPGPPLCLRRISGVVGYFGDGFHSRTHTL